MNKNNSQLHVCANILCNRIQMSAMVRKGSCGEEQVVGVGLGEPGTAHSDTAPLLGYRGQDWGPDTQARSYSYTCDLNMLVIFFFLSCFPRGKGCRPLPTVALGTWPPELGCLLAPVGIAQWLGWRERWLTQGKHY